MKYWLMKSEPTEYSIDDLCHDRQAMWDGVRNYQARNFMRDAMRVGDRALFYHSNTDEIGIAGTMKIIETAYPDPTQFDPKDKHYDAASNPAKPRWLCVGVGFIDKFPQVVTLAELKQDLGFADMMVTQKGNRLSIQPVAKKHFERICRLTKRKGQ